MNRILDRKRSSYKVISKIGDGAFGDIFKVTFLQNPNKYLALKHIKYKGCYSEQISIKNEIACLSALRHENIIEFVDVLVKSSEVNIIMEYADGGNLQDFVLMAPILSKVVVFDIFVQILQAVEFCHENNIAHRDLTPSNVLLTGRGVVKLADFGLSMACMDSEGNPVLCHDFLGNKIYIAPEVIRKQLHDAILADLWSLGVLLFFLVFSVNPFQGFDDEILRQQETIINILGIKPKDNLDNLFTTTMVDFLQIAPHQRLRISKALCNWKALNIQECDKRSTIKGNISCIKL